MLEATRRYDLAVSTVERDQYARILRATEKDCDIASVLTSKLAHARRSDARPAVVPQE